MTSSLQETKRRLLNQRSGHLLTQYERLNNQLNYTANAAERYQLELQLKSLEEQIDAVEQELTQLEAAVKAGAGPDAGGVVGETGGVCKVLILAANPPGTEHLRLDEEVREVREALQRARRRERFQLAERWAVTVDHLRQALLDEEPHLLHFCGHGKEQGLVLEDAQRRAVLVNTAWLADLFKMFRDKLECVLMNACYSASQAEAIAQHIPYVIGMQGRILDRNAINFAVPFYDALGAGRDLPFAFALGQHAIARYGNAGREDSAILLQSKPGG